MLHGLAQLLQHSLDIALLNRGLALDKISNLVGTHKMVVVNCSGKILTVSLRIGAGVVLELNKFLTHNFFDCYIFEFLHFSAAEVGCGLLR